MKENWLNARMPESKKKVLMTIRIAPEILEWYKAQGKGYQTLINEVLKQYAEHNQKIKE